MRNTCIALVLALVLGLVAVEAGPTFPAKLIGSDLRPVVASSCNSTRTDFSCCGQLEFIMHFPYIGPVYINDTVCASLVVVPNTQNVTVTLMINGETRRKDTLPAKDLDTVCAPIPFDVDVCLKWNVTWNPSFGRLSGCAGVAAVVTAVTVHDIKLGCFDLHTI